MDLSCWGEPPLSPPPAPVPSPLDHLTICHTPLSLLLVSFVQWTTRSTLMAPQPFGESGRCWLFDVAELIRCSATAQTYIWSQMRSEVCPLYSTDTWFKRPWCMLPQFRQQKVLRSSPSPSNKLCVEEASLQAEAGLLNDLYMGVPLLYLNMKTYECACRGGSTATARWKVESQTQPCGFALIKGIWLWWMLFIRHTRVGLWERKTTSREW